MQLLTRWSGQPAPGTRVLYIFADPFTVVTYFLSRSDNILRSLRFHCEMMGCRLPEIESLILKQSHTKEDVLCGLVATGPEGRGGNVTKVVLGGAAKMGGRGGGLAEGGDLLGLEAHFRAWWEHDSRHYDIMFVRYETMVGIQVLRQRQRPTDLDRDSGMQAARQAAE